MVLENVELGFDVNVCGKNVVIVVNILKVVGIVMCFMLCIMLLGL